VERLVSAVLNEMNDEWIAFPRRYLPEGSMAGIYAECTERNPVLPDTTNTTSN
jgi:putative transposase